MLNNCATSCEAAEQQASSDTRELEGINSFFDLSAYDIHGSLVKFSKFKGQVTIVVNVASYCGFTDEHYRQLVQLWSQVKDIGKINIMAFPCNQFGRQEPKSNEEINEFALGYGVGFQMMSKVNVNGAQASPVYKYLKKVAGPSTIGWNFATVSLKLLHKGKTYPLFTQSSVCDFFSQYYVVAPDGTVESHSDVEPLELKELALNKLAGDEL